jgi:hypothetical protein
MRFSERAVVQKNKTHIYQISHNRYSLLPIALPRFFHFSLDSRGQRKRTI